MCGGEKNYRKKDQKAYLDPAFFGHFGEFLLGQDEHKLENNDQLKSIKSALIAAYHQGGIDQLSEDDIKSLKKSARGVCKSACAHPI